MKKLTTILSLLFIVTLTGCTVGANYSGLNAGGNNPGAVPTSIAVTPTNPSVEIDSTQQFLATGTYSDGTTQDVTSSVTWTASDSSVTFSSTTSGLATGTIDGGPFTISAELGSISGTTTLTVTPATLVSIVVTPLNANVPEGLTRQFTATGTYSDDTTEDITTSVTWASSAVNVATINLATGLATAVSNSGSSTIRATMGLISGTATLTASSAVLESIAVTTVPAGVSLIAPNGGKQQFKATGTYSDGTQFDITSSVTWTSSDPNVTFNSSGLATCADTGAVSGISITATDPGTSISGSTSIDVVLLSSITITSAGGATTIAIGGTLQFTAIGSYSGGQTQDLTSSYSLWTSSSSTRVSIGSNTGLATGVATGASNIRATYAGVASNLFSLTAVVPAPLKMFVTTSTWNGQLGQGGSPITLAAIDALCMADANKPAGGGTYKAMFATTTAGQTRRACTTTNCAGGTGENVNWVMLPNRDYYRANGTTLVGTTNNGGVIPLNLTNSISGVDEWYWTGLNGNGSTWSTGENCANWTYAGNNPVVAGGREGHGNGTTGNTNGNDGALAGWVQFCNTLLNLVCVEQ